MKNEKTPAFILHTQIVAVISAFILTWQIANEPTILEQVAMSIFGTAFMLLVTFIPSAIFVGFLYLLIFIFSKGDKKIATTLTDTSATLFKNTSL